MHQRGLRAHNGKWYVPESIEGLAQLEMDYISATAFVDRGEKTVSKAAFDIHVGRHVLER
jgi:hypothetical protein